MRAYTGFVDRKYLMTVLGKPKEEKLPMLKVSMEFCLRSGAPGPCQGVVGRIDTGADITCVPPLVVGEYDRIKPTDIMDPVAVTLRLPSGRVSLPVYRAVVSMADRRLPGPYCATCGEELRDSRCRTCHDGDPLSVFRIAVIQGLRYPLIGWDLISRFLMVSNPWGKRVVLTDWLATRAATSWMHVGAAYLGP